MTKVRISCPITWYKQCEWIQKNCKGYIDVTEWSAWNIGYDDIYYYLSDEDAIIFYLMWS
jgi:hypothetical protein